MLVPSRFNADSVSLLYSCFIIFANVVSFRRRWLRHHLSKIARKHEFSENSPRVGMPFDCANVARCFAAIACNRSGNRSSSNRFAGERTGACRFSSRKGIEVKRHAIITWAVAAATAIATAAALPTLALVQDGKSAEQLAQHGAAQRIATVGAAMRSRPVWAVPLVDALGKTGTRILGTVMVALALAVAGGLLTA